MQLRIICNLLKDLVMRIVEQLQQQQIHIFSIGLKNLKNKVLRSCNKQALQYYIKTYESSRRKNLKIFLH